jgi:hypothetical protein
MRIRMHFTGLVVLAFAVAMATQLEAQGSVGCVSATNPYAAVYRDGYGGMVSRTDPASVTTRNGLGLPNLANAQVTIVSDTATCRKASAAYDSVFSLPAPTEAPLVLQLGAQYIVVKGLGNHGDRANVLFNQYFTVAQKKIWY